MEKQNMITQDMIQRHGNQIQETTRQNQTQEHNEQESTVMPSMSFWYFVRHCKKY